jgi:hypothetical protein
MMALLGGCRATAAHHKPLAKDLRNAGQQEHMKLWRLIGQLDFSP